MSEIPEKTVVIFRRWCGKDGTIFALFPCEPHDAQGYFCSSYEHHGQHGKADPDGCIGRSKPVKPDDPEVVELAAELKGRGYNLKPVRRNRREFFERRQQVAREYRDSTREEE